MKQTPVLSLCFVVIILVSYAGGQTCPSNGILCYPQDCSPQYRQCSGSTFYAVQNTPSGTLCKAGQIVYPSDCPSSSASSSTAASSTSAKASTTSSSSTSAKVSTTSTSSSSSGSTTGSTSTTCSLSNIFSSSDFSTLFPNANGAAKRGDAKQYAIFNYTSLIDAAKSYPTFACTGDIATRKKELAAFLAQTSQETSGWWSGQPYQWGYFFSTESCLGANTCGAYCSAGTYPCASGKIYCGRGPIQLSWNYNYGQISKALFGDSSILINNPDLVLTDATTAFKTALWFWMTTQSPKPSCHDVITGGWTPSSTDINAGRLAGFGMITNIINGGIECGQASTASNNRIGYFQAYTNYFQVSPGANLVCDKMQSY